jgi:hypothetical protein
MFGRTALDNYPGATVLRVETDADGIYQAHPGLDPARPADLQPSSNGRPHGGYGSASTAQSYTAAAEVLV